MTAEPCRIALQPGESIQAAIDAAPKGAVITLAEVEWRENIKIAKPLTLRGLGAGRSVMRAQRFRQSVVWVDTFTEAEQDQVILESIMLTGARMPVIGGSYGLAVEGSARIMLINCTMVGNQGGIRLKNSARATIEGTALSNRVEGIRLEDSSQAVITGSTMYATMNGICLLNSAQARVDETTFSDNMQAIALHSGEAMINDCVITGRRYWHNGIQLTGTARASIRGCTLSGNYKGIEISGSAQLMLEGNEVLRHRLCGVMLSGSHFTGYVAGRDNVIPDSDAQDGNKTAVSPDALEFLLTTRGGQLTGRPG